MNQPTDEQIFNHMKQDEPFCSECDSENVIKVEYPDYRTYKCSSCGFEPTPPEEY